ncbi:MAG: hypothetical protein CMJ45_10090 [Planctomyces sp.]|nr:hypothetical protein [Planctomyces sp.]
MTVKDDLHRLVDKLPKKELQSAKRYLEYLRNMGDPVQRALLEAPEDDEPTTPEENKIAEEAWQEYLRGEGISAEEAKRELLS